MIDGLEQYLTRLPHGYDVEKHGYHCKVVCIGDSVESSFLGDLFSAYPIKIGAVVNIKGRDWQCKKIGKNGDGEVVADMYEKGVEL